MKILLNQPVAPCLKTLGRYLEQVNTSGWHTNFGPLHELLTLRLEEYLGVDNLLLVSNGTLALHVAYRALDVKRSICTPFSYAATASSLAWEKIPTSFVDIDPNSLNICPILVDKMLEESPDIDSLVATHVYGNPCRVDLFDKIGAKRGIKVVYDGAHAFGVKYSGKSVLSYGDATTLSFHATKVFHTAEGGAVIFKDKSRYDRAKRLINFGLSSSGIPQEAGINAKLSEYQAAVGLTLLDSIDAILHHRSSLFDTYTKILESYVALPFWNTNTSFKNGSYFPIILESEEEKSRVKVLLHKLDIPSRDYFSASLNMVFKPEDVCPVSQSVASRILCLPLHYYLSTEEASFIANTIKQRKL